MLIFHWFYKQNGVFSKKKLLWCGFCAFYEKKVAVVRERWCGRPPFSSHSNFFFVNVVKPMVLATFFEFWGARRVAFRDRPFNKRENPIVQALFGEKNSKLLFIRFTFCSF